MYIPLLFFSWFQNWFFLNQKVKNYNNKKPKLPKNQNGGSCEEKNKKICPPYIFLVNKTIFWPKSHYTNYKKTPKTTSEVVDKFNLIRHGTKRMFVLCVFPHCVVHHIHYWACQTMLLCVTFLTQNTTYVTIESTEFPLIPRTVLDLTLTSNSMCSLLMWLFR